MQRENIPNNHNIPRKDSRLFHSQKESIAVYTVLCILLKMRQELGLEAMLEYLEKYLSIVGEHNPELAMAVQKALNLMDAGKMYAAACKKE